MRSQTQDSIKTKSAKKGQQSIDIIQETRKLVKNLNQKQKFRIAKLHLENALAYKAPRLDTYSQNTSRVFRVCYNLQTSQIWQTALLILAYIFMYLVIWSATSPPTSVIIIQFCILMLMWMDVIMEIYHKSFQVLRLTSRFQLRFYVRIIVLMLLLVDEIIVVANPGWGIRPFLVLRCMLPIFYDSNVRKSFQALLSSYKDIFVYLFFYTIVIVSFAIVANQVIELPPDAGEDQFTNNYRQLGKCIYIMYVLSSYDAYPDNQLIAIRTSVWVYTLFIVFIFLNVFFFVTIPATILFNSFRETRSKIILIDQIKQQHSLIMSFVSLGEENLNISQNKLIKFLLYVYKNKVRYVDHITQVCLKLDDNNNGVIHVNQYMQLCNVLQSDTSMLPPKFHDWDRWLQFRRTINQTLKIKQIVLSDQFKIVSSIVILLTFVNCLLCIYTQYHVFDVIDVVLIFAFVIEIFLKMIGLGPENFFKDPFNTLDFIIITFGLILELIPENFIPRNGDVLFKMLRVFRITILIQLISEKSKLNSQIYIKATKLVSQMAIIVPIVLKFFPLFMVTYYVLGIMGMQIFRASAVSNHDPSPYTFYDQFSNFNNFIYSQFIYVQILVQAGWATIAYNHAFKYGYYGLVMLYFVMCHVIIVIVLSSLLKGITWQVYYTVQQQYNNRANAHLLNKNKQQMLQRKKQMVQQVKAKLQQKQLLIPDNLITKQLYENKIDIKIMQKLKKIYFDTRNNVKNKEKNKRSSLVTHMIKDRKIAIDEIQEYQRMEPSLYVSSHQIIMNRLMESLQIKDIQDLKEQDIQQEMEKVLSKIVLHNKIQFSQTIVYPKVLVQFLTTKLRPPKADFLRYGFDIDKDVIANKDSVDFLTYGLNVLLEIQVSQRQQKTKIIQNMVKQNIISQEQSIKVLTKKLIQKDSSFDSNWIMRKAFLSDTNEQLIKKFQFQYFSNVYGKSFKQINKVTIQPLLRLQSRLTYCLRNLLRYPQINQLQFFTILSTIQDTISNKLLKKGSLFKFAYQIDQMSDNWFSIQLRQSNQLKVHFIKNGIWIYHKAMKPGEISVAEDVFNWEDIANRKDRSSCEKYVKMLYQSFESLAFCLINQKNFFQSNPNKVIYDLFTFYKQVQNVKRIKVRQISISKIMLVILSKQDQRDQPLDYELTDLKLQQQEDSSTKKTMFFKFDESQNETFQKLKRMELMDHERIVQTQGIPFTYIINLMTEIQDIINLYEVNFIFQLEQFLNNKFDQVQIKQAE